MQTDDVQHTSASDSVRLSEYPFELGERVTGTGIAGEVVDRPGPYSVTVRQDPSGVRITASVTGLRKG